MERYAVGETVDIPIRDPATGQVSEVARGVVVRLEGDYVFVRWPDGVVVPYLPDQIGPRGAFRVERPPRPRREEEDGG